MKLSIVVVNYNVQPFLEQCLYSIQKASKNLNLEIIVVDNNSVDGSIGMLKNKFPHINLIENKQNTGFSYANNQAIKIAKGEYILLLNPDTVIEEDTLEKVISFMDTRPDAGGLGVKMLDGKGNFLPESKRGLPTPWVAFYKIFGLSALFPTSKIFGKYHLGYLDENKINKVDILSGAFMLIRKNVFDKTGLLDETFFMYGEDIDLSYRITLAGYNNYYFPETRIIHYKGESTKKSSINYVFVFYRAMAIFAKKHFSQNNAQTFSILINLAIYIRAGIAIFSQFIKSIALPTVDFSIILLGLFFIKEQYEKNIKFIEGGSYSNDLVGIAFTFYTLIWIYTTYLSGGYDKPIKLSKIAKGILLGTAVILIGYSLLPEAYRFSRALILLGASWSFLSLFISRIILHFSGLKNFNFNPEKNKRIAIIGTQEEFERVNLLLKQTNLNNSFIGYITIDDADKKTPNVIGRIDQTEEIIKIHKINEVIFCSRDLSSQSIIDFMHRLISSDVDFKIAPPESMSIIGSNSIDTAGDLYIIDVNSINKPNNKRNKRMIDFVSSILFLILSPILFLVQKNKLGFIKNSIYVLFNAKSWVGYGNENQEHLPKIKTSIFSPLDGIPDSNITNEAKSRILLTYSKNYIVQNDINIILKNITFLGR